MTEPHRTVVPPSAAALSGLVGAAVALATGQLASAMLGASPSPLLAVGGRFIDRFAANLKEFAVRTFGTNDKPALVTGIVIISLLLGAALGLLARRHRWAPLAGLGAFGAFGTWAQATDPQVGTAAAVVVGVASVAAGVATIELLLRLAAGELHLAPLTGDDEVPGPAATASRRGFLGAAGGLALAATGGAALARSFTRTDVVAAGRKVRLGTPRRPAPVPTSQPFAVDGLSPYVTPVSDFYRIDTALSAPRVDPDSWKLRIHGMVDHPFELTYAELLGMPSVEQTVTLQCVSNEVGGDLVGNATWQGVPLSTLLDRAGVQARAEQVFTRSADGWTAGFPTSALDDQRVALLAYAMNGQRLPVEHGFPARLVVAGLYGYVSATKWITDIELTTWDGADGYWVPRGWSKEGPIKLASRIDVPQSGATVAAGTVAIGGVAWLPDTGISGVEVSIDDGPWQACELGRVASENTWVQWRYRWNATPGDHQVRARAIDANGKYQTAKVADPAPNGATGLDQVSFTVQGS